MGFLDNTSITVDAVLTKKGREKLASGIENFEITLGTWQGIYLFEHRTMKHTRTIKLHLFG